MEILVHRIYTGNSYYISRNIENQGIGRNLERIQIHIQTYLSFKTIYDNVSVESERILENSKRLVILHIRDEDIVAETRAGHVRKQLPEFRDADVM